MSNTLIAVDPGVMHCGVAMFSTEFKELIAARWIEASKALSVTMHIDRRLQLPHTLSNIIASTYDDASLELVIELPEIYRTAAQKGRQSDIRDLTTVVGAIAGTFDRGGCKVTFYEPKRWKGQVPKLVMNERIMGRLTAEECSRIDMPKNKKNATDVKDAIGVGLYHFGRLG